MEMGHLVNFCCHAPSWWAACFSSMAMRKAAPTLPQGTSAAHCSSPLSTRRASREHLESSVHRTHSKSSWHTIAPAEDRCKECHHCSRRVRHHRPRKCPAQTAARHCGASALPVQTRKHCRCTLDSHHWQRICFIMSRVSCGATAV